MIVWAWQNTVALLFYGKFLSNSMRAKRWLERDLESLFSLRHHRKNYLFMRYPIIRLAVAVKQPSRYIYDSRDTHAAVARIHTHLDPYKWYYMNGTAKIPVHLRVYYICIPLKPANSRVAIGPGIPPIVLPLHYYTLYFPFIASYTSVRYSILLFNSKFF